jgi:hypothetical protein
MAETVIDTFWWQQPDLIGHQWEVRCRQGPGIRHLHVLSYIGVEDGIHYEVAVINAEDMTIEHSDLVPTKIMERFLASVQDHTVKGLPPRLTAWDRLVMDDA